jgi:hypothetical protein
VVSGVQPAPPCMQRTMGVLMHVSGAQGMHITSCGLQRSPSGPRVMLPKCGCCRGIYSATKAAVQRLTDALRIELRPLGIQVGCRQSSRQPRPHAVAAGPGWGSVLQQFQAASRVCASKSFPALCICDSAPHGVGIQGPLY